MMMLYLVKDPLYRSIRYRVFIDNGFRPVKVEYKEFPDGETYVRFIDDIDPSGAYIVLSRGYPEQDKNIFRTILIVRTLRDLGAKKIILCIPYLPYSRQDKRFLPREAVSAKILGECLISMGADYILTIDVHNPSIFEFLGNKFVNIQTTDLWAKFISKICESKTCGLISPDIGRKSLVHMIANKCGIDMVSFIKIRDLSTGRIVRHQPEDSEQFSKFIMGKEVIFIIDDILATGGTISNISRTIRDYGFNGEIITCFTHCLMLRDAYDRLINAGVNRIICTDTVENPFIHDDVFVGPYILEALRTLI